MTTAAAAPTRRRRGRLAALVAAALAGLAVLLALDLASDAGRIAGLLLARAGDATGLEWRATGPASIAWRPMPRLVLRDVESRTADGRLLLRGRRIDVAVPWATLRGGDLAIDAVRIDGLAIDGEVASDWWTARPPGPPSPWPRLDRFAATDLSWRKGGWRVEVTSLELGGVAPGGRVVGAARGRLSSPADGPFPDGIAFASEIEATLAGDTARPAIHDLDLRLGDSVPPDALRLRGDLGTAPGWTADLQGRITRWPDALPALPPPLAADAPITFALDQRGEGPLTATSRLRLATAGASAELEGRPDALLAWIRQPAASTLPPLRGRARADVLEVDGVRIEGLEVGVGEAAAPGAAREASR